MTDTIESLRARVAELEALDFRGYAALGSGQYILWACPSTTELPPELVISLSTEEEKVGRTVGDLRSVEPGKMIQPETMAVRLAFLSVAGLDALEQQLRILREESFPESTSLHHQLAAKDQRIAELEEQLENEQARGIHSCHPGCLRDGCVNRRLRDQLAAQALTIKTMREAVLWAADRVELDSIKEYETENDCTCPLCNAITLPDSSTEVLQAWLDKQFGEPVASIVEMSIAGVPTPKGIDWLSAPNLGENLYRKPEIK